MRRDYLAGRQFSGVLHGNNLDAHANQFGTAPFYKHLGQVSVWIKAVLFRSLIHAEDHGAALCCVHKQEKGLFAMLGAVDSCFQVGALVLQVAEHLPPSRLWRDVACI